MLCLILVSLLAPTQDVAHILPLNFAQQSEKYVFALGTVFTGILLPKYDKLVTVPVLFVPCVTSNLPEPFSRIIIL